MTDTSAQDLIDVLVTDHREVESMFAELESGASEPRHRRRITDVVIAELVRHAIAEEMYLYLAVRKELADGDKIADHEIREHAEAEKIMDEIDDIDATDPRFEDGLGRLMATIRHHIRDEEIEVFPRLRHRMMPGELRELGRKVELAKKVAPTRPHPFAPDKPPFNKLLAPGMGLVDRVRDLLAKRPTSPDEV
jgi:hemerythrin superfamily protein